MVFAVGVEVTADTPARTGPWTPDVYVSFDIEGTLHIIAHRSEMGQGIRTGLPAVVADEMEADWARVVVEQATGDPKYGDQVLAKFTTIHLFIPIHGFAGCTHTNNIEVTITIDIIGFYCRGYR